MTKALVILKLIAPIVFMIFGVFASFIGEYDKAAYFTALTAVCLLMEKAA